MNTLKPNLIFIFILIFVNLAIPLKAYAHSDISQSVVKVFSGVCNLVDRPLRGSGLLIEFESRVFVLTSEHVVLHGSDDFCHSILLQNRVKIETKFIAADWGAGLALLEVLDLKKELAPIKLNNNSNPVKIINAQDIIVAGYPFDFENIVIDKSGKVLKSKSDRTVFVSHNEVFETVDAHGEFGMSGGAIFNKDLEWVGILTHRYVTKKTDTDVFNSSFDSLEQDIATLTEETHLLAIHADYAFSWMQSILNGDHPTFVQDPTKQLFKQNFVFSAGLAFELIKSDHPEFIENASKDIIPSSRIRISIDPFASARPTIPTEHSLKIIFSKWFRELKRDKIEFIEFYAIKTKTNSSTEVIFISNLESFFKLLRLKDSMAIKLDHSSSIDFSPNLLGLSKCLLEIENNKNLYNSLAKHIDTLEAIKAIIRHIENDEIDYLHPKDIRDIRDSDGNKEFWMVLSAYDLKITSQILKDLDRIHELLNK